MIGLIFFSFYLILGVNGLPNGAPEAACGDVTDIVPDHGPYAASNNDDIPYRVDLSLFDYYNGTYTPGWYYRCKCYTLASVFVVISTSLLLYSCIGVRQ